MERVLTVRAAELEDWEQLWPLVLSMGTDDSEADARTRFALLADEPLWGILVATDQGLIIGYAAVQDLGTHFRYGDAHRTARLHDLWVAERRRRHGAGRALMSAVHTWASTRVRYLEWQAHETRSAPFYEHLGYRGEPCPQPDYPTFEFDFAAR